VPLSIRIPRPRRMAQAMVVAAGLITALPGAAQACTLSSAPHSQLFAKFGDLNQYSLLPWSTFGNGASGWSLSNATVSGGGAGLLPGDVRAIAIQPGGSATTPKMCVGFSTPTVRFMARQASGYMATMDAYVLWTDWSGQSHSTFVGWVYGTTTWQPTFPILVSALPLWEAGGTLTIRLKLVPASGAGNWYVDDVFLDPYSRG